jgi:protein O-mannosyl-transferase
MVPATPDTGLILFSQRWVRVCILIAAVVLVYWNSFNTPFLFDDTGAVINNPTIRHLGSLAVFNPPADGSTTTGRPLVNFSFALNYAMSAQQVWSYHALNLLIHILAALALMGALQSALAGPVLGVRYGPVSPLLAFSVALLWALHPLLTESVVCVAQRTESLCGLFYLLTFYCFGQALKPGIKAPRAWLIFSFFSCLAGMGSKEVMVTAPVLVFLADRTFFAGSFASAWRERKGFYCSLAATWLLTAWLVWRSGGERGTAAGFGLGISWWNYLLQQNEALILYLKLSFWPHPLVLDYGTEIAHSIRDVWWQGIIVVVLLLTTGWALYRKPAVGFVGAWFFAILAPSSSVMPLVTQTMAEHRMYLPLAMIVCGTVLAGYHWLGPKANWAFAAVLLLFGGMTMVRNRDYRDTVAIWRDTVEKYPHNPRAHNNLAWALQTKGQPGDANIHFARAIELQPDYISARYNWGVALLDQGRADDAITQFESAVKLFPNHADAQLNLGNALMQVQRDASAIEHYEIALQLKPAADAHFNLGVALINVDRPAEAAEHLHAALQLNPGLPEAHYQLGRTAEALGHSIEAEKNYDHALQLAPDHVRAHRQLGLLLARRNEFIRAEENFRAVIRLAPADPNAHANLGNVLLMEGKPNDAIGCYEESLRLRPGDPRTLDNLKIARDSLR